MTHKSHVPSSWHPRDHDHLVQENEQHCTKQEAEAAQLNSLSIRFVKFKNTLVLATIDLDALRKLSWSGIPEEIRHTVWKLLLVGGFLFVFVYLYFCVHLFCFGVLPIFLYAFAPQNTLALMNHSGPLSHIGIPAR